MDGDFRIDLGEILETVATAEVFLVFFPLLRRTLLVDTRVSSEDTPMIRLLPMATSPDERLRSLRRLRPRFPQPNRLNVIPWPKYVASLERLGVIDKLKARFSMLGYEFLLDHLDIMMVDLGELERAEMVAVIRGERYDTLWEDRS